LKSEEQTADSDLTQRVSKLSPERLRLLARAVRKTATSTAVVENASPLVPIRTEGANPPLFLAHPVGGGVIAYNDLARYLSDAQPVYALQNLTLESAVSETVAPTIEQMAVRYVDAIQTVQPRGPYLVAGASMGGTLAMEMAQQLAARSESVALVALLDTPARVIPRLKGAPMQKALALDLALLASIVASGAGREPVVSVTDLENVDTELQIAFVFQKLREHELVPANLGVASFRVALSAFRRNFDAMERYQPRPWHGRVLMLRASEISDVMKGTAGPTCDDPTFGWQEWCTQPIMVEFVPGDHGRMNIEPNVQVLGATLQRSIDKVLKAESAQ